MLFFTQQNTSIKFYLFFSIRQHLSINISLLKLQDLFNLLSLSLLVLITNSDKSLLIVLDRLNRSKYV